MSKSNILKSIVKFFNKEANAIELGELDAWLKKDENVKVFNKYVETHYLIEVYMEQYNLEKAKEVIYNKVKRKERRVFFKRVSIAASILLIMGVFFFYNWDNESGDIKHKVTSNKQELIEAGSDKAVLTLGNGEKVVLGKGETYKTNLISSDGEELVYLEEDKIDDKKETVLYNYLTIPKGGQFVINLSDGTKVWLNSDSQLKYPVKFLANTLREVELVYGEAYFDVSHSTNHNGASFNVKTRQQNVNVLGTEFNIKAYKEDKFIKTTLVSGKVNVAKADKHKVLKPKQQSIIVRGSHAKINVIEVDVDHEISWKNGLFAFNEERLDEIMVALSRWYDIKVFFKTDRCKNLVFTGILERTKSITDVLELIEGTSGEDEVEFEIKGKIIIIE